MIIAFHRSALPTHYDKEAKHYDTFNEEASASTNRVIERILCKYKIKSVLDLTCGTGSQVFWLTKEGYEVTGSDINARMLKIARDRARREKLKVRFLEGDMRKVEIGRFDGVITIFNSVGHLTKKDFEKTMVNVHRNLREGGLYVFDINNLSYLLDGDNISKLTIDWRRVMGDTSVRTIQYSTIDRSGVLASYTTLCVQKNFGKPRISTSAQTLQVYTAKQLSEMLSRNGFKVISQHSIDGAKFLEKESDRILTVAMKE